MKPLFFLYVWLNLTRIAGLRKENLVKHIRKRIIQTGRLFFSSSLTYPSNYSFFIPQNDSSLKNSLNTVNIRVILGQFLSLNVKNDKKFMVL